VRTERARCGGLVFGLVFGEGACVTDRGGMQKKMGARAATSLTW
jgi:hypothetical protein